jgi:hypothetical protein
LATVANLGDIGREEEAHAAFGQEDADAALWIGLDDGAAQAAAIGEQDHVVTAREGHSGPQREHQSDSRKQMPHRQTISLGFRYQVGMRSTIAKSLLGTCGILPSQHDFGRRYTAEPRSRAGTARKRSHGRRYAARERAHGSRSLASLAARERAHGGRFAARERAHGGRFALRERAYGGCNE